MARKWNLFYCRIQSFLKKFVLSIIFILAFSLPIGFNYFEKVVAQTPENIDKNPNQILIIDNQQILDNNLLNLGLTFYQEGKINDAKKEWLKAKREYQQKQDNLHRALVLNYLSLAHQKLGEWREAETTINQGLKLIQSEVNLNQSSHKLAVFARILNTKGKVSLALGKPEIALDDWQRGENIYQQLKDYEGVIISQLNQAQALQRLGRLKDAFDLLTGLKNNSKNQPETIKINGLISLGNTLRQIGELEESLKILTETVTLAENSQSPFFISNALMALGNTQRAIANQEIELLRTKTDFFVPLIEQQTISNFELALNSYQKVIEIGLSAFKLYSDQKELEIAIAKLKLPAQLNKLSLLADITEIAFSQAEKRQLEVPSFLQKFPQEAYNLQNNINLPPEPKFITQNSVYSHINFADSLIRLKSHSQIFNDISWSEIEAILQQAISQAQILEDKKSASEAWGKIGKIAEINQEWQKAEKFTRKALLLSQSLKANEISYKWQWQLGRIKYQQKDRKGAIASYSQAVNNLKSLRSDLVALNSDLEFNFRENVEPVYRELVSILLETEANPSEISQARDIIESLQLAELDNFFRVACIDAKPILIDKITDQKAPTAAVIYTIVLSDRFEIVLKLPQEKLRHYSIPLKDLPKVEKILERLAQSLTQPNSQETLPLAQQAYNWLIRPIEEDLAKSQVKTLVFVLDSPLRNVPMSVLHDGQKYLIEKYSIALSPGLQLIEPQPIAQKQLKALTAGLTEARGGFPPLKYVADELNTVKSQVTTELLLDSDFTSTAFQDKINQLSFPVVHLATHGQFSSQAENTFILTWNDRINVNQLNSLLRSRNPRNQETLELLVLSACETLTGDRRATLGLAGIAVRAGTRSTLATLWRVNDEASALLMGRFYQELANSNTSLTKAEALRQCQLTLLKDSRFKRPYFWASYVLVGNWL